MKRNLVPSTEMTLYVNLNAKVVNQCAISPRANMTCNTYLSEIRVQRQDATHGKSDEICSEVRNESHRAHRRRIPESGGHGYCTPQAIFGQRKATYPPDA